MASTESLAQQSSALSRLLIDLSSDYFAEIHDWAGVPIQNAAVLVDVLRQYVLSREAAVASGAVTVHLHEQALNTTRDALLNAFGQAKADGFWAWVDRVLVDESHWWGSQLADLASIDAKAWSQLRQAAPVAHDLQRAIALFGERSRSLARHVETLRAAAPSPWDEHLARYYITTDSSPLDHLHGLCADELWRRIWMGSASDRLARQVGDLMEAAQSVVNSPGFYDHRSALWAGVAGG